MTVKKQEWTVRIIVHHDYGDNRVERDEMRNNRDAAWLGEFLRYAGISRRLATIKDEDKEREVFELRCPHPPLHETRIWADQNAGRLRSFGIDAAAAPKWDGFETIR